MSKRYACEGCGEPAEYCDATGRLMVPILPYENSNGTTSWYHPECHVEMMSDDDAEPE